MTISKVREVPTELPPVRLYLDDLEEIQAILLQAYRSVIEEQNRNADPAAVIEPKFIFTINGNTVADSIDDLPKLGRSTKSLEMRLDPWMGATLSIKYLFNALYLNKLSHEQHWATYGRVLEAIRGRRITVKDALNSLPGWIVYVCFVVAWFIPLGLTFIRKAVKGGWIVDVVYFSLLTILVIEYFRPSRVIFAYSHKQTFARSESVRRGLRDFGFLLLGSALGEVVKRLVAWIFK